MLKNRPMLKNKKVDMTVHPLLDEVDDDPMVENTPDDAPAAVTKPAEGRDPRQTLGIGLMLLGVIALLVAWWGVSGTTDTVDQLSYIGSGLAVGLGLLGVGTVLVMVCEHARDREVILELKREQLELKGELRRLEAGLAGEFDHLERTLRSEQLRRA